MECDLQDLDNYCKITVCGVFEMCLVFNYDLSFGKAFPNYLFFEVWWFYLQMDLACSVAFALNFDRMDCSVLENNWALTFSFYPLSNTSTLSCSRRRNPPPAWTPLRRQMSLASKFWSTYFDNFKDCPAMQDAKYYSYQKRFDSLAIE